MTNIFSETEEYVAGLLNSQPELSSCPFLPENLRDIEFQIKSALGKQGLVGIIHSPKASYVGKYEDKSLAWETELGCDIFENVLINRGKKDQPIVTGQDVAAHVFDVLCPLSGEREGQISPLDYEQGEQDSLVVNKLRFKCLVQREDPDAYTQVLLPDGTTMKFLWKGTLTKAMVDQANLSGLEYFEMSLGNKITDIGQAALSGLTGLTNIYNFPKVKEIKDNTFFGCTSLHGVELQEGLETIYAQAFYGCSSIQELVIPASVKKIGYDAFKGMTNMYVLYFLGKTQSQLHDLKIWGVDHYPWGITDESKIHTEL